MEKKLTRYSKNRLSSIFTKLYGKGYLTRLEDLDGPGSPRLDVSWTRTGKLVSPPPEPGMLEGVGIMFDGAQHIGKKETVYYFKINRKGWL